MGPSKPTYYARLRQNFCKIFLFLTLVVVPLNAIASPTERGTLFLQESKILGSTELLVGKSGIRLDVPKTKTTLIACAPDWRLILVNDNQHKYFISEKNNFHAPSGLTVALYRTSDTSVLKAKSMQPTSLLGVKVNKVEMTGEQAMRPGDPKWRKLLLHSATAWIDQTCPLPPPVVRAIENMYSLPSNRGLPLQVTTVNNKGNVERELVLLKVSAKSVSASDFTVPKRYLAVTKQEELMDKKPDEIMDLMPGL